MLRCCRVNAPRALARHQHHWGGGAMAMQHVAGSSLTTGSLQALESFSDASDSWGSKSNDSPGTPVCLPCR